jgi:copper(I)-binding protein
MQYPGGPHLELVDLKVDLPGSRFIPVTFRFENNGSLAMNVFVEGFGLPTVSPLTPPS